MAVPILKTWKRYFADPDEGLGSSYERILINNKLENIINLFGIQSILEVPAFGFTGISGINSMDIARKGYRVTVCDNDEERVKLIRDAWGNTGIDADILYVNDFLNLPFSRTSFDMVWNYSALWFVKDLDKFAQKISAFINKVCLFFVPNRSGLGYLSQKYFSGASSMSLLQEKNIIPQNIIRTMEKHNWTLLEKHYIDNPPWPDIGMSKTELLTKIGLSGLLKEKGRDRITYSILDYYTGKLPDFREKMLKFAWFERIAPDLIKKFWSHHRYLLFVKKT
ncbi:MAG: methyltransferase domain-containing protein [Candidatus Cloacimonetes bacterium]|nr:methyltransferase domain-containing protein [Candidatus Cloacimonadota bacterium]